MKKITSWFLAITLMANIAFLSSCKKDDDNDPVINKVEGVEFADAYGYLQISWDAVDEALLYMVQLNGVNVSEIPMIYPFYTIDYPTIGTEITINAFKDLTMSELIASTTVKFEGISSNEVTNITFSEINNMVMVSWDPVTDAQSYMVSIAGIPDSEYPITSTSYNAGYVMDGMVFTIEAFSDPAMENLIATGTATYNSQSTGSIDNLIYTESNNIITVSWDAYQNANTYNVFVNGLNFLSSPTSDSYAYLSNLNNGDIIRVEAYSDNMGTNMIAFAEITYTITAEAPYPVTNLQQTDAGSDYATMSWSNPIGDYTSIEVYEGPRANGILETTITNGYTSYTANYLISGYSYDFYFYTVNSNNPEGLQYSEPAIVTVTPESAMSMANTEWYNPGSSMFPVEMNLTFHTNTVDWEEGDYYHEGLSYTFDSNSRTGIIDDGGYYEGEFEVSTDGTTLTFMEFSNSQELQNKKFYSKDKTDNLLKPGFLNWVFYLHFRLIFL